ncbi:uncharacterized protein LOC125885137 isoform X4 [Epinephelus fuscoguttatus]|uniref:uncharacterized protein LOC125885137 isoform X4 n=1 Tax=Epinephelus fuscoguttatus TaxID=293821 RepID=UPI0020D06A87|nr:uncharacterized protein LOC125885137 isoform X4 [Epinephelus fuscoguttatus]
MVKWELCFVLLLPLTMCFDSEEDEDSSSFPKKVIEALTGAAMIMLLSAVIFGLLYRGMRQGSQPEPPSSHHKTQEPEDIEPYSTFVQREGGLYSVVRLHVCDTDTINSNTVTTQDTHAGNFLQSSNYTVCAK